LLVQPAFALNAPTIAPTQLDFDASQAPKTCNDRTEFSRLLSTWLPEATMVDDAERRLVVRIRRSPTGAKLADLTLVDAADATNRDHHERFSAKVECYRVLYETAYAAAKLLGAFNKPPPPEPLVCPACPACSSCPACPTCPALPLQSPRFVLSAHSMPRVSFGAGVFVGMTNRPQAHPGPYVSLSVVPFSGVPDFRFEFDGAWAPRQALQTVPMFVSLCHAHHGLRLCGGLATMFLSAENMKDARDFTLSASLRMGTEFRIAGPFSIRSDIFALLPLTQQITLDSPNPFAAGAVAIGVWSFE